MDQQVANPATMIWNFNIIFVKYNLIDLFIDCGSTLSLSHLPYVTQVL